MPRSGQFALERDRISWAVTLRNQGTSASIEAAPPPASPTAEELAQAVAYEAAVMEAGLAEEYNDVMAREEADEVEHEYDTSLL